jgi:hypothetical protein
MSQELRTALTVLATRLRQRIIDGLSDGSLRQAETTVLVWKSDQFTKTDGGIVPSGASGNYTSRKDWSQGVFLFSSRKDQCNQNDSEVVQSSRHQVANTLVFIFQPLALLVA